MSHLIFMYNEYNEMWDLLNETEQYNKAIMNQTKYGLDSMRLPIAIKLSLNTRNVISTQ